MVFNSVHIANGIQFSKDSKRYSIQYIKQKVFNSVHIAKGIQIST